MFKRVQKRIRKREREEELGLDSEMKEVLGLQDTDSEESDSSSEDEEGGSGHEDGEGGSSDEGSEEDADENEDDDIQDDQIMASVGDVPEDSDTDSDIEDSIPEMSVTEAVKDPVYVVSLQPQIKACILCHGKLLKNNKMSEVHKASKAHNRRFSRFIELVGKAGPEADVRDLIRAMNVESKPASRPTDGAPSKRALKRKEKLAAVKAKRAAKKKAAERARRRIEERKRKNALGTDTTNAETLSEPVRKKRKVEREEESSKDSSASPQKNEDDSAGVASSGDTAPQTAVKAKRGKKDETTVLKDKKHKPGKKPLTKRPHKAKSLVVDTKIS